MFSFSFLVIVLSENEDDETETETRDFIEKGTCLVNLNKETFEQLNSDEKTETEKTEIFRSIFRDIFPKCSLTFEAFEAQCKVKSCGLKIKISLTEDQER